MVADRSDVQKILNYEWQQMRIAAELYKAAEEAGNAPQGTRSAFFDSFAMHTRNLHCFLFKDRQRSDDLSAVDYAPDAVSYRHDPRRVLQAHIAKANKTVSHLTAVRLTATADDRKWDATSVLDAMDEVLKRFASASDGKFSFEPLPIEPPRSTVRHATVIGSTENFRRS